MRRKRIPIMVSTWNLLVPPRWAGNQPQQSCSYSMVTKMRIKVWQTMTSFVSNKFDHFFLSLILHLIPSFHGRNQTSLLKLFQWNMLLAMRTFWRSANKSAPFTTHLIERILLGGKEPLLYRCQQFVFFNETESDFLKLHSKLEWRCWETRKTRQFNVIMCE